MKRQSDISLNLVLIFRRAFLQSAENQSFRRARVSHFLLWFLSLMSECCRQTELISRRMLEGFLSGLIKFESLHARIIRINIAKWWWLSMPHVPPLYLLSGTIVRPRQTQRKFCFCRIIASNRINDTKLTGRAVLFVLLHFKVFCYMRGPVWNKR